MTRLGVLGILVALGLGAIAFGAKRNRLGLALAVSVLVLAGFWFATVTAYYTDWRDTDGFVDCWPNCTTSQDASAAILVGAPIVLVAWLAAALLIRRRRGRDVRT